MSLQLEEGEVMEVSAMTKKKVENKELTEKELTMLRELAEAEIEWAISDIEMDEMTFQEGMSKISNLVGAAKKLWVMETAATTLRLKVR